MIIQHQFPLGGEPKQNKSGLVMFFCLLAISAAAGFYYNYTLTSKIKKNA